MTRNRDPESLEGRELADAVTADSERAEAGLRRGNVLVTMVGLLFVLAVVTGGVLVNRFYPPPSPPNTATQAQLNDLRADLDEYLAGRGGLRDQQYAKTVYTLCELARDTGNASVLADYDCAAVLAAPSPSVTQAPAVTRTPSPTPSPRPSTSSTSTSSPTQGAAAPTSAAAPPTSGSSSPPSSGPTRTRTRTPTAAPAAPSPVLSVQLDLCNLPIVTLCPGGTS